MLKHNTLAGNVLDDSFCRNVNEEKHRFLTFPNDAYGIRTFYAKSKRKTSYINLLPIRRFVLIPLVYISL